jgi:autotransporter strand-loop-strand O-heptosyltransferase
MYSNLIKNPDNIKFTISFSFVQGAKVEITSPISAEYYVEFIDKKTGNKVYSTYIKNNHWTKCTLEYFIDWNIKVYQKENNDFVLIEDYHYDATNKRVFISLDSKSLGDTLAWFPYAEEFRKKHNCQLICSTFNNHFFQSQYPEIEFVEPGGIIYNLYAMYNIGWFYKDNNVLNEFKHPCEVKTQEMQKTASDILGLDFKEVIPKIVKPQVNKKKQISIGFHSTAQTKYWNNPTGWQEVVDWCKDKGYEVIMLSKEGDTYMGNNHPTGLKYLDSYDMNNTLKTLCESEVFIGISSGLSWLSWATNTPTIIISGFTEPYTEPESCYHIDAPPGKCRGCFNSHQLDAGDWNWCPIHKDTDRQFECSKSITSEMVIEKLKEILVVS